MSLYLTADQKANGQANFYEAVGRQGISRRGFLKGLLAAGAAVPISAAAYYGYQKLHGNPVRAGLIGGGDEGGILVSQHNPDYLKFIAVADIRPSNRKRIFTGDPAPSPRKGFNGVYGEGEAKKIKVYDTYKELLANKDIEAVVIAVPLSLHAQVAMDAMKAGKHVLCEKLMAWNVAQCKDMIRVSDETDRILTIGHQRHYSLLYAHGVELLNSGELGEVRYIRALWHRNNTWPKLDKEGKPEFDAQHHPLYRDGWYPAILDEDRAALQPHIREHGFKSMEELVRWRLYNRTGGGLMAELGSHQLDACSIFLGKVHPLAVSGTGTKSFYRDQYKAGEREVDDHVFVTFEFPGPNYFVKDNGGKPTHRVNDKDDVVVVTYSSISTNSFEPYGECVMGTRGSMVVEKEESIMLFPERDQNKKVGEERPTGVTVATTGGGKPTVDATATTGALEPAKAQAAGQAALGAGPVSRGYTEEIAHFAYCVRMHQEAKGSDEKLKWRQTPRCHGRVAMADAVIALTSNLAMKHRQRIEYKPEWFEAESKEVPDKENQPEGITA
jgi:predicted dehydrogenase